MGVKTEYGRETRVAILDELTAYRREHGYYPTQDEVAASLDLSRASLQWHVASLVQQGFLTYTPRSFARTLRITHKSRERLR